MAEYHGNFTERTRAAIGTARAKAQAAGAGCVTTGHLLHALLQEASDPFAAVIAALKLERATFPNGTSTTERCPAAEAPPRDLEWSAEAKRALIGSMAIARELEHTYVGPSHVFLGLLREEAGWAGRTLRVAGVAMDEATAIVERLVPAHRDAVA